VVFDGVKVKVEVELVIGRGRMGIIVLRRTYVAVERVAGERRLRRFLVMAEVYEVLVIYKTNWNPWHADPKILRPTLRIKP
jgi:hypothetical protein